MKPRVIYMGTPEFAVPALERLASSGICEVSLVVTQPDRRAGRGKKMVSPAVKAAADGLDLPVLQTPTLRHAGARQQIIDIQPDLIVVAAFGMILGKWILDLPTHGCVNLHASLLPKYRGANPIASAIAEGESETGVSLMRMDRGLDTGPVYATSVLTIAPNDTTESLTPKLASAAGDLLETNLEGLLAGMMTAVPQGSGATLTRLMTKDDGWLDFRRPASKLECHVRAMWPWPRAWTTDASGERIQIHDASVADGIEGPPGNILHRDNHVLVATGEGALELKRVQFPGGRPVEGSALEHHRSLTEGSVLGSVGEPGETPPLVTSMSS